MGKFCAACRTGSVRTGAETVRVWRVPTRSDDLELQTSDGCTAEHRSDSLRFAAHSYVGPLDTARLRHARGPDSQHEGSASSLRAGPAARKARLDTEGLRREAGSCVGPGNACPTHSGNGCAAIPIPGSLGVKGLRDCSDQAHPCTNEYSVHRAAAVLCRSRVGPARVRHREREVSSGSRQCRSTGEAARSLGRAARYDGPPCGPACERHPRRKHTWRSDAAGDLPDRVQFHTSGG